MDIPEEVNVLLQELPEQWANTKKIATTVKQQVSPLQATEVVSIRNKITLFEAHIQLFREVFKQYDFFQFDCFKPYLLMDRINDDMYLCEREMREIQKSGSLFEVNIPEFKVLKQCRKELRMLKVSTKSPQFLRSLKIVFFSQPTLCMFYNLLNFYQLNTACHMWNFELLLFLSKPIYLLTPFLKTVTIFY